MEPVDSVAVTATDVTKDCGKLQYENNNTWKINKKQSSSESVLKFHYKYTVLISGVVCMEM